jgi:Zn finger protein HypA/HybF involved in hydrogenase expression
MKEKKNKVYFAEGDPDYGCTYIAARTSKEAKQIALGCEVAQLIDNPYINLRIKRCWQVEGTNYKGELDIYQINELGLAWWWCPNCENENFEMLDDQTYKCKKCGETNKIPLY